MYNSIRPILILLTNDKWPVTSQDSLKMHFDDNSVCLTYHKPTSLMILGYLGKDLSWLQTLKPVVFWGHFRNTKHSMLYIPDTEQG